MQAQSQSALLSLLRTMTDVTLYQHVTTLLCMLVTITDVIWYQHVITLVMNAELSSCVYAAV